MKLLIVFLLSFSVSHTSIGQKTSFNKELGKLFLELPIDSPLSYLVNSAKVDSLIKEKETYHSFFTGGFDKHQSFVFQPKDYEIDIYSESNSLLIFISANYDNTTGNLRCKQYEKLVTKFRKLSEKSEKFKVQGCAGQHGEGYKFFDNKINKNRFLSISYSYSDNSIRIFYVHTDNWK